METLPLQRRFARIGIGSFVLIVLILGLVGAVALVADGSVRSEQQNLAPAQLASRDLATGLSDQETGERGFIITGDPSYLAPYRNGHLAAEHRGGVHQLAGHAGVRAVP